MAVYVITERLIVGLVGFFLLAGCSEEEFNPIRPAQRVNPPRDSEFSAVIGGSLNSLGISPSRSLEVYLGPSEHGYMAQEGYWHDSRGEIQLMVMVDNNLVFRQIEGPLAAAALPNYEKRTETNLPWSIEDALEFGLRVLKELYGELSDWKLVHSKMSTLEPSEAILALLFEPTDESEHFALGGVEMRVDVERGALDSIFLSLYYPSEHAPSDGMDSLPRGQQGSRPTH